MDVQSTVKRIGLFGGSFDPVHVGHLIVAQDAAEKFGLSSVIFIPAAIPPHKQHLQQISAEHRLNMLQLAVDSDIRFSVSDVEIRRGGISYTFDTIFDLKSKYSDSELLLIVGSDTLVDLHNWYNIDELLELCDVATFMRPGMCDFKIIPDKIMLSECQKNKLLDSTFESHMVGVSSSEVRMRVAEGLGIRYFVPPEVEQYIFEHGLYKG